MLLKRRYSPHDYPHHRTLLFSRRPRRLLAGSRLHRNSERNALDGRISGRKRILGFGDSPGRARHLARRYGALPMAGLADLGGGGLAHSERILRPNCNSGSFNGRGAFAAFLHPETRHRGCGDVYTLRAAARPAPALFALAALDSTHCATCEKIRLGRPRSRSRAYQLWRVPQPLDTGT